MSDDDVLAGMEAAARDAGGVLAWTRALDDPMIEEVIQAVVIVVERLEPQRPEDGPLVSLTIGDGIKQQTYVMTQLAWETLSGRKGKQ